MQTTGVAARSSLANRIGKRLTNFGQLPLALRGAALLGAVLVIAGISWAVHSSAEPEYAALLPPLDLADAADVTKLLTEQKIAYRLEDEGKSILVPRDALYQARLIVAGKSLPHNGSSGFELFDKSNLNLSERSEKITWLRALSGELARTIQNLDPIEHARVHLTLPEDEVFSDSKKVASASVTLRLKRGADLSRENVNAVVALVSRAVPGLDAEHIAVVTQHGKVLWDAATQARAQTSDDDATQRFQKSLEERITSMLTPVVGEGRCTVRVAALLDMSEKEMRTNRILTDNVQARSRQVSEENYKAGQAPLTPSPAPAPTNPQSDYGRRSEVAQYDWGSEEVREKVPGGRIKQLNVAVLLDERSFTNLSVVRVETLVRDAVGLDRSRGDRLTVQTLPFRAVPDSVETEAAPPVTPTADTRSLFAGFAAGSAAVSLLLLLAALFVRGRPSTALSQGNGHRGDPAHTAALLESWMKEDEIRA